MIEQAKSYADALRSGTPVFLSFTRTQLAETIDALVLEVERLTKVDVERERIATVMQATVDAKEAADRFIKSKVEPNYDHVICPGCCHQFRAIPVNVQDELAALRAENEQWQSKWSAMEEASIRQFQRVVKLAEERDTLQQENEMLKAEKMLDYTSLYDKYSDALAEVQELRVQREQAQADAVRYRWLRDNNAVVLECTFQRKGYRSTAPDAQRETWYEHEGWIVSTMPITTEAFGTMDAAIDAAREVIEKEDDREYCPRCNEQWSGTSCGIPNCGWVKGDIDE